MNKLNRREFLRISALAAAGAALAGCGPKATPVPATEEPKAPEPTQAPPIEEPKAPEPTQAPPSEEGFTIQYWVGWGANYGEIWDELKKTDEFKELIGPNDLEVRGSMGEDAFLTAIAGGTPPDGASNISYVDYMARGVLLPMGDMVATSSLIKEEDFIEINWDMGFYEGVQYGVPANECFVQFGVNYNIRLIEEAGLDPENPPVTWDDWLVWHEALTEFDGAGNLVQIGLDPTDAMGEGIWGYLPWMVSSSWGFEWFDAEAGKFDFDNEHVIDSFKTFKEFIDMMGGMDNLGALRSVEGQGTWGGSYNAEVQAAIIEGYWHPGETKQEKPEILEYNRATWLPVPESRRGVKVQGAGGHLVCILKEAQHPNEMFQIAEFLNTKMACDVIFATAGWLPALKSYIEQVDPSPLPGLDFYFRSVDEATEWYGPSNCPIGSFIDSNYSWDLREKVFRDEMTAEEAAAELQKRVEQEWIDAGFG